MDLADQKSPHGRDPLGSKALSGTFNTDKSPLQAQTRKSSPLSVENKQLVNTIQTSLKTRKIIRESISQSIDLSNDDGTMLDESQLLDEKI